MAGLDWRHDRSLGRVTRTLRVPEITPYFWIIKGLSTAMGEATSDYLVHALPPVTAVLLGFAGHSRSIASTPLVGRRSTGRRWWRPSPSAPPSG